MTPYATFAELDAALGFNAKAGFNLSKIQIEDAETMAKWRAYLNTYEVGGGKTVVSTVVSLLKGIEVTIITVPPILIRPWVRWLRQVSDNVVQYQGTPAKRRDMQSSLRTARWIVVSHAIYREDFTELSRAVQDRHYEIIVDEAQALKNVSSVLYRKVSNLGNGHPLGMLTATPTNKPVDAYSYIKLKSPALYRTLGHFEQMHVGKRDFFKNPTEWINLDLLSKNFNLQKILRTKEEIHGYDNKPLYPDTSYDLEPAHQRLYEKLVDEQLLSLDDGTKIDATTAQRLYHALQQIIVNYDFYSGDPSKRSAAYDLVDSVIDQTNCLDEGASKLIIWTIYKRTSRSVWQYLLGKGINAVAAYSEVKSQDSFDTFMADPKCRILVAQPSSAGAGLNPQSVCWESLALETDTVAMRTIQANGRIDRMGQKHKPTIRMGVAANTIQVGLVRRLLDNADLIARVEGSKKTLREILMGR